MNCLTTPTKYLLKLLVRPTQLGFSQLSPDADTYFMLEHRRESHRLLLHMALPGLNNDQILYADPEGKCSLRDTLATLVETQLNSPSREIRIIPVSIFHGRLPHRERSTCKALFGESWGGGTRLEHTLQLLINGRQTLMQADRPLALSELVENNTEDCARKAARVLRTHFQIRRRAIIGPDLSHRRTLMDQVMRHPDVQAAVEQQATETGTNRMEVEQSSRKALDSIAADFSPAVARVLNAIVTTACKFLYQSVKVRNTEAVRDYALDHQLVYLPCHRSHMDYILLSWVLYRQGLMLPHAAAGDNLNIPVFGTLLKKGGAIFMRRRFQGDRIYSALYKAYLEAMSHHGHALEYYIEGGRSRTGRLLSAKLGLLKMTTESFITTPQRPVAIVPVWIGYDRLVESHSYRAELAGQSKKKESLGGTLGAASMLMNRYGSAYLSFGQPIPLSQALVQNEDPLQQAAHLGRLTLQAINRAAQITPASLIATVLLATPRLAYPRQALLQRLAALSTLLRTLYGEHHFSSLDGRPEAWVEHALQLNQVYEQEGTIALDEAQAQELTFYRNNIAHLLALPGLYLLFARRLDGAASQTISRLLKELYPTLNAELTLSCTEGDLTLHLRQIRDNLEGAGLLQREGRRWHSVDSPLARMMIMSVEPILLRYYFTLRVIDRYQQIGRDDLVDSTTQLAQAIHREYGFKSLEYADPIVIRSFVEQATASGLLAENDGRIQCVSTPEPLLKLARRILRPHLVTKVEALLDSSV